MARSATIVLPAADLALKQPVHRVLRGEVVEDLPGDLLLALGEGEGQLRVEGVEEAAGSRSPCHGGELAVRVAAAGEGHLEDERLVPLQALASVLDVGLGARPVDLEEGSGRDTNPRPSRRASGSGSTASGALGSTASTALAIFQDSRPLHAG